MAKTTRARGGTISGVEQAEQQDVLLRGRRLVVRDGALEFSAGGGAAPDLRVFRDPATGGLYIGTLVVGAVSGPLSVDGYTTLQGAQTNGDFASLGDITVGTAGKGLNIKEGSNARMGAATLSGGTVVVSTTEVSASSRIFLTVQSLGTVTAPKAIGVTARSAGTSFTITSADNTDTSVVAWMIVEPA